MVRNLPPTIDQEQFVQQVAPLASHSYLRVCAGDSSLGEFNFGRAYIAFNRSDEAMEFQQRFDRFVFVDARGHEYAAQIEMAPFQRIPRKIKTDYEPDTYILENTPEFKEFEARQEQWTSSTLPSTEQCLEQLELEKQQAANAAVKSKLLEYVNQKHAEKQKQKELKKYSTEKRKKKSKTKSDDLSKKSKNKSQSKTSKESIFTQPKTKVTKILTKQKNKSGKSEAKANDRATKESTVKEFKILKNEDREQKVKIPNENKDRNRDGKEVKSKSETPTFTVKLVNREKPEASGTSTKEPKTKFRSNDEKEADRRSKSKEKPSMELYQPTARIKSNKKPNAEFGSSAKESSKTEKKRFVKVYTRSKPSD